MIVFYTTHCPMCNVLKKKLDEKQIPYTENTNTDEMIKLGFTQVPILKINDKYMNFVDSLKWIKEQ